MSKTLHGWMLSPVLVLTAGCGSDFALPEGDAQRGRETFLELECNACHSVGDIESAGQPDFDKNLGGQVSRVKSYEDLVTSIINPSHKLAPAMATDVLPEGSAANGESPMPVYNDVMTVQQLVDVVTFLQPHYRVAMPRRDYPIYYP